MNIQEILKNPELIAGLNSTEKTKVYMQLNNLKNDINNKLVEYKAKKELLEKQKQDIQEELFSDAGVDTMENLITYVSKLQEDFNGALNQQAIELSDVLNKLNI